MPEPMNDEDILDALAWETWQLTQGHNIQWTHEALFMAGRVSQAATIQTQRTALDERDGLLKKALSALNVYIPAPLCRDCADNHGTCPNNEGRPCDPDSAEIWAVGVRNDISENLFARKSLNKDKAISPTEQKES